MKASRRQNITHLKQLSAKKFIELCRYIRDDLGGIITPDNTKVNLKIDGAGLRIGMDRYCQFFIESSRSGPIFSPGAFANYTRQKRGVSNPIANSYDDVFEKLQNFEPLQQILRQTFPWETKLFCELLYTPLAKRVGDKLQFLTVKYDEAVLGKDFTLVFYKTENPDGATNLPEFVTEQFCRISNENIVILNQRVKEFKPIDLSYLVNGFFGDLTPAAERAMNLPTAANSAKYLDVIDTYRINMSRKVLATHFPHVLNNGEMEGVVMYFGNGEIVKVISEQFTKEKFHG